MSSKPSKTNSRDAIHVRGVLLAHSGLIGREQSFGKKVHSAMDLQPPAKGWHGYVRVSAKHESGQVKLQKAQGSEGATKLFSIPGSLLPRVLSGDQCIFDAMLAAFKLGKSEANLVVTPFTPIFPELFKVGQQTYFRVDLRRLCDDQFNGTGGENIKVTRLYCKLSGDLGERISSLNFSGKNVVTSAVIRDVLGFDEQRRDVAPFSVDALNEGFVQRSLDPVSCRVQWDDGSGVAAALNMDRFGNFSFYMKSCETITLLYPIFGYLSRIGALVRSSMDPLARSDAGLHEVDSR